MIKLQVWKASNVNDCQDDWIWELHDELYCKDRKDAEWKARCYLSLFGGVFKLEIVEE